MKQQRNKFKFKRNYLHFSSFIFVCRSTLRTFVLQAHKHCRTFQNVSGSFLCFFYGEIIAVLIVQVLIYELRNSLILTEVVDGYK